MTIIKATWKVAALGVCGLPLALAVQAQSPTIVISPTDPVLSVGGMQQFTASAAVTPRNVSAGGEYTCISLSNGTVRCTGRNQFGQLADGTAANSSVLAASSLVGVSRVVAGDEFVCALLGDGTVSCWGLGESGQLGDGAFTQYTNVPVAVSGLTGATALASGYAHACALLADATLRCWGGNGEGQLGNGSTASPGLPHPVAVTGITGAIAIATGAYHTCAVLEDRTVRCWGRNDQAQLGDGTRATSSTPVVVEGIANVASISGGGVHSCAVLTDGTVRCWGENEFGQIGDGTNATALTPVRVVGISDAVAVEAGWRHTCARLGDGTARCWGENQFGQLGDGTIANSAIPVPVSGITGAVGLTAGWWHHSCALLGDGRVRCWGMNEWGQLGNGTTTDSPTTIAVAMNGTGLTWMSSNPVVATIASSARATAVASGSTTISVTDTSGATASTTLTVRQRAALSVIPAGAGTGSVISNPAGITCGTQCSALFDIGTTVTLTPSADSRSTFGGWSGCDAVSGETCTVTVNAATTVTATFDLKRFTLTVNRAGLLDDLGNVSSNPPGISCGTDCSESYTIDTVVTLTASPDLLFSGWSGCDAVSGPSCTVTLTSARSVTASFLGIPQ